MKDNTIYVTDGKTKRKIAWRRNGLLGHIGCMQSRINNMQQSMCMGREESLELDEIYNKLTAFRMKLRKTKSTNVIIQKPVDIHLSYKKNTNYA